MEIFDVIDDSPVITPEGLYIPAMRQIWERNKKDEDLRDREVVALYHLVDPRSIYSKMEESERISEVLADYLPHWGSLEDADEDFMLAIEKYEKLIHGPASRRYSGAVKAAERITNYLETEEVRGGRDGNFSQVETSIKNSVEAMKALEELKKLADREVQEKASKFKGGKTFGVLQKNKL